MSSFEDGSADGVGVSGTIDVFSSIRVIKGVYSAVLDRARERRAFLLSVLVRPCDIFDELRYLVTIGTRENDRADPAIVGEVFSPRCATAMGAGDLANIEITGEVNMGFNDDPFGGPLSPPAH